MAELLAGTFSIRSASDSEVWVGVPEDGRPPLVRVVPGQNNSQFVITPLGDGKYSIATPWIRPGSFLEPDNDYIASIGIESFPWNISKIDGGVYMITTPGLTPPPGLAWTLGDSNPDAPVGLSIWGIPQSTQNWWITPYYPV